MFLILLSLVAGTLSVPLGGERKCGYESCTQAEAGLLNVHIVPHTHDDVGWLKTVDQYYYGSRNNIQKAGVQYILDSVIKELWEDPKRRFVYIETAYFWKWWTKQGEETRVKVNTLVREGRLQFAGGAWSMNDEAATHYQSVIDQFTYGLRKLNETFGECGTPRVGWQIDPFGHSREFSSLLSAMGYDGLFLGRIDFQDKRNRLRTKGMEMVWRGDDDLGNSSDIFTGVLFNTYSPPPGFCFDVLCDDEPIVDDPNSPIYNVDDKVSSFLLKISEMSAAYRTRNILVTMGDDFNYQDANMWFRNLDKLILYTNMKAAKDGLNIKLFYSTPDCYLKAVKKSNPTLPTKQDDFFPYASDPTAYWTGYFTSRPTTKYFEREANRYLQMAKNLQVLANLPEHNKFVLDEFKSAMGVMQHHDAITGTEKQHVARDYERLLENALQDSLLVARQAFSKLQEKSDQPVFSYDRCHLNESSCVTSENSQRFVVTIYNPVGWDVLEPVRIPVKGGTYEVYAPNGAKIPSQLVTIPEAVIKIPTRNSEATHELIFIAKLHPLGIKSFYIKKIQKIYKRNVEITERNGYYGNINDYWRHVREQVDLDVRNIEGGAVSEGIPDPVITGLPDDVRIDNIDINMLKDRYDLPENVGELRNIVGADGNRVTGNRFTGNRVTGNQVAGDRFTGNRVSGNHVTGNQVAGDRFTGNLVTGNHVTGNEVAGNRVTGNRYLGKNENYPVLNEEELRMLSDEPRIVERSAEYYMENEYMKVRVDNTTGLVTHLVTPDRTTTLQINFHYWRGCVGDNTEPATRSSGAYIFRPNSSQPSVIPYSRTESVHGDILQELRSTTALNAFSAISLYKGLNYLEHNFVIGPIDIEDGDGKEYTVNYATDIINNGVFFTDSNGRQYLKRKLNWRPAFNATIAEPVAGNYYPIVNEIFIRNSNVKMAVLTDRAQGGSSLENGELEIMVHRRLLHDDAFGVGEALNETARGLGLVMRGTHRLVSVDPKNTVFEKKLLIQTHLKPIVFVSDAGTVSYEQWMKMNTCFKGMKELPPGVHLLTLEPLGVDSLLLRVENYLEKSKNSTVFVDFGDVFNNLKVLSIRETTLGGNRWLSDVDKWRWNTENEFSDSFNNYDGESGNNNGENSNNNGENSNNNGDDGNNNGDSFDIKEEGLKVILKAKQIRTFVANYEMVV